MGLPMFSRGSCECTAATSSVAPHPGSHPLPLLAAAGRAAGNAAACVYTHMVTRLNLPVRRYGHGRPVSLTRRCHVTILDTME